VPVSWLSTGISKPIFFHYFNLPFGQNSENKKVAKLKFCEWLIIGIIDVLIWLNYKKYQSLLLYLVPLPYGLVIAGTCTGIINTNTGTTPANLILSRSSGWRRRVETTPPDTPASRCSYCKQQQIWFWCHTKSADQIIAITGIVTGTGTDTGVQ